MPHRQRRPRAAAHESAHLHVAGEATYIDDIRELAGTLHAALGLSPVAHGKLLAIDLDAIARAAGCGRRLHRSRHPGRQRLRPDRAGDDPILADGVVHYLGQPMFAVIAADRRVGAPRRRAGQGVRHARAAAGAADGARGPCREVVCGAADAPGARRCTPRARSRAAPLQGFAVGGRPGAVLPRRPDLLRDPARRRRRCWCIARPSIPSEMQHVVAHALGLRANQVHGGMPAHGRRLRRQGIAIGAVCLRRRARGEAARPPGQAAPRSRRRLHDHRRAATASSTTSTSATTTTAACSASRLI